MTQVWDYFAAAPNLFEMLYQQTLPKLGQAASYVKTDNLAEDSSDEDGDLMADMLSIGQDPLVIPTESTFDEDN